MFSPAEPPAPPEAPPIAQPRRLTITTNCATVEQFVQKHSRHADRASLFLTTPRPVPVGPRRPFVIRLSSGEAIMRGEGEVVESMAPSAPGVQSGMRIKLLELDADARAVHAQLMASGRTMPGPPPPLPRTATPPRPATAPPATPRTISGVRDITTHPLHDLTDEGLESMIESRLGEAADSSAPVLTEADRRTRPAYWVFAAGAITALAACASGIAMGYGIWGRTEPAARLPVGGLAATGQAPTAQPTPTSPPGAAPIPTPLVPPNLQPGARGCSATVRSTPPGAHVLWDGRRLGRTPLESVAVPCGRAAVTLERARHEPLVKQVSAAPGEPARLAVRLSRPSAELELTSNPPGAVFAVKGRVVGKGPARAAVRAFQMVTVSATKPGYAPWKQRVYVRPPKEVLQATLKPLAAKRVSWSESRGLSP